MHIDKPDWVKHGDAGIYSIHAAAEGDRVVTGGGDQKVRVWSSACLQHAAIETNPSKPNLLTTLADHFGPVNVVRFSPCGRMLASGSDDKVVLVYRLEAGGGVLRAAFGSGEPPPVENWKLCQTLKGHAADVTDLAWCPLGEYLATASIDNTAQVWAVGSEAGGMGTGALSMSPWQMAASLAAHTGYVKGVTWDPVGKFLATQSDDKSVLVWRTEDWSVVRRVEGHFDKCFGNSFALRLAWSPDGRHLAATLGTSSTKHCAVFLERQTWEGKHHVVGHKAAVVVVRFSPFLFTPKDSAEKRRNQVFAMGSQDCRVTVWSSGVPRPLLVLKRAFEKTVVDLSWSSDGYTLYCASIDGTVAVATFTEEELGVRVPMEQMASLLKSTYGDRARTSQLAEDPLLLQYELGAVGGVPKAGAPAGMAVASSNGHSIPGAPAQPQHAHAAASPSPHSTVQAGPAGQPALAVQSTVVATPGMQAGHDAHRPIPEQPPSGPPRQTVSVTASGKRRITPEQMGCTQLVSEPASDSATVEPQAKRPVVRADVCASAGPAPPHAAAGLPPAAAYAPVALHPALEGAPALRLQAPRAAAKIACRLLGGGASPDGEREAVTLEGTNLEAVAGATPSLSKGSCVVCCRRGRTTLWKDQVGSPATLAAGTAHFAALALMGGGLVAWSAAGRRVTPPVVMDSPVAFLAAAAPWRLMAVTCTARLQVWDLERRKCILNESVMPVINAAATADASVSSIQLSRAGLPLAILSNRSALVFDLDMQCWMRVADDTFLGSDFATTLTYTAAPKPWASVRGSGEGAAAGAEFARLQAEALAAVARPVLTGLAGMTTSDQRAVTRRHLETMLASSAAMRAPQEYRRWLVAYAQHLTKDADEARLREICMDLLGPVRGCSSSFEKPTIDNNSSLPSPPPLPVPADAAGGFGNWMSCERIRNPHRIPGPLEFQPMLLGGACDVGCFCVTST